MDNSSHRVARICHSHFLRVSLAHGFDYNSAYASHLWWRRSPQCLRDKGWPIHLKRNADASSTDGEASSFLFCPTRILQGEYDDLQLYRPRRRCVLRRISINALTASWSKSQIFESKRQSTMMRPILAAAEIIIVVRNTEVLENSRGPWFRGTSALPFFRSEELSKLWANLGSPKIEDLVTFVSFMKQILYRCASSESHPNGWLAPGW